MKSKKILITETEPLLISSLPARPNQDIASGGKSYSSAELRAAFDKLPLLLVGRYNDLLSDMESGDILELISIDGDGDRSLKTFFEDLLSGVWAGYATVDGAPLHNIIKDITRRLSAIEEVISG